MDSTTVLDLFRHCEGLLEGHFQLSSGLHSGGYLQCARVLQHPEHAATLARHSPSRWRHWSRRWCCRPRWVVS